MARKAKSRPKTPADIAAEKLARRRMDFEAVGLPPESAQLQANDAVEIRREGQRNVETARRADAFDALKDGMAPGAYDAARRLEHDYRVRNGEAERGRGPDRVSCTAGPTTDAMIAAAERIEAVNRQLPIRDAVLLSSLIQQRDATWRDSVKRLTGETNPHAQGAVVRGACLNLRDAYASLERRRVA